MSDLQQLYIDQGARFMLPYGSVVVAAGSGFVLIGPDRSRSRIRLRAAGQSVGPFNYDTPFEIVATGPATFQVFNLQAISQADLDTLMTLPVGTRATVASGSTWTSKYWDGIDWVTSSGGGSDGEDAGRVLDETISDAADNITLAGSTAALVTIDREGANTVTLVGRSTDGTLEVRRPYLIRVIGSGTTTLTAGDGVTLIYEAGRTAEIAAAHAPVTAMLVDDSTWWLFGGLAQA